MRLIELALDHASAFAWTLNGPDYAEVRFYLDENLSPKIAVIARGLGLDVVSAHELGHTGSNDTELLVIAAREGRCFVTRDYKDFGVLARAAPTEQRAHSGTLLVPQSLISGGYHAVAAALVRVDEVTPAGLGPYGMDWLRGT